MKQQHQRDSDIDDIDPEYLAAEQRLEDMLMAFDRDDDDLLERRSYAMNKQQQRKPSIDDIDPEYLAAEQRFEDMLTAFDRDYEDLLERRSYAMNMQQQRKPSLDDIDPESPGPMAAVRPDDLLQRPSAVMPRPTADLKAEYAIRCMFDEEWR
jgi:hypothetical protein